MTTNNNVTATDLIATQNAIEKLNKSLAKSSLDDLVKAKTQRSLLLVDCSGSMGEIVQNPGERAIRKIDALRKVVDDLRTTHPVPVAAFGVRAQGQVEVVDVVPEPQGGTPLDLAILFGKDQGATRLVVVTDGEPNDESSAFEAATQFGGPIDVFYVGHRHGRGPAFAKELAERTGGTYGLTDLGSTSGTKALVGKITLALGDGSEIL
jgi:Mg-chelatase subunit ChlD